jgi:hypothetical protein
VEKILSTWTQDSSASASTIQIVDADIVNATVPQLLIVIFCVNFTTFHTADAKAFDHNIFTISSRDITTQVKMTHTPRTTI